jgi:hypothetical protein
MAVQPALGVVIIVLATLLFLVVPAAIHFSGPSSSDNGGEVETFSIFALFFPAAITALIIFVICLPLLIGAVALLVIFGCILNVVWFIVMLWPYVVERLFGSPEKTSHVNLMYPMEAALSRAAAMGHWYAQMLNVRQNLCSMRDEGPRENRTKICTANGFSCECAVKTTIPS